MLGGSYLCDGKNIIFLSSFSMAKQSLVSLNIGKNSFPSSSFDNQTSKSLSSSLVSSVKERSLLKRLKELCQICKFEKPRQYKLHTFRHHFGSLCANHNVAYRKALAWLGHSSSEMLDLYYHLYDEDSQKAMVALANSSVVDGCFGSQYSTFEGNGAVKNQENSASSSNARACKHPVFNSGEGGIPGFALEPKSAIADFHRGCCPYGGSNATCDPDDVGKSFPHTL